MLRGSAGFSGYLGYVRSASRDKYDMLLACMSYNSSCASQRDTIVWASAGLSNGTCWS